MVRVEAVVVGWRKALVELELVVPQGGIWDSGKASR